MSKSVVAALFAAVLLAGCTAPTPAPAPVPPSGRLGLLLPAGGGDWSGYREAADSSAVGSAMN